MYGVEELEADHKEDNPVDTAEGSNMHDIENVNERDNEGNDDDDNSDDDMDEDKEEDQEESVVEVLTKMEVGKRTRKLNNVRRLTFPVR